MKNSLPEPPPPVAKQVETKRMHGVEIEDAYGWLKAPNWRDVLRDPAALPQPIRAVIEAENGFAAKALGPFEPLRKSLVDEMRGRIKEDDAEVPLPDGRFLYYARHGEGGQHPIFCRAEQDGGAEQTLLDGDAEGAGKSFFEIAEALHSPDHASLAWSADENGSELHAIRVRNLAKGEDGGDIVRETDGSFVWSVDFDFSILRPRRRESSSGGGSAASGRRRSRD